MGSWMALVLVHCRVKLRDLIKTVNGKVCAYEGD